MLAEKEVTHETVQIDLRNGEQLGKAYRRINPLCAVPALRTESGLVLTDNAANQPAGNCVLRRTTFDSAWRFPSHCGRSCKARTVKHALIR